MAKLIIQGRVGGEDRWQDLGECKNQGEAKKLIADKFSNQINVENLRVVMPVVHCKTEIVFIDDLADDSTEKETDTIGDGNNDDSPKAYVNKRNPEEKASVTFDKKSAPKDKKKHDKKSSKKASKKKPSSKSKTRTRSQNSYTDEELKLIFFERSCQLGHWAKGTNFDHDNLPAYTTLYARLGGISNITDMVIHKLKEDPISARYQEIINQYYGEDYAGVDVIAKLAKGVKPDGTVKSINYSNLNL